MQSLLKCCLLVCCVGSWGLATPVFSQMPPVSAGTGLAINAQGHVITNQHVIAGCHEIVVDQPGMRPLPAFLLAADAQMDLAVLQTPIVIEKFPRFAVKQNLGESVILAGFPLPGTLAFSLNINFGNISAMSGLGNDYSRFQHSSTTNAGNSGGPVLNQAGNVIGIAVSKLQGHDNIGFAIKSLFVTLFLKQNNIPYESEQTRRPMEQALVSALSKEFVVRVVCWR